MTRSPTATATGTPCATCTWRDDFSGSLDPAWSWVRGDATHWSLGGRLGFLRITTQAGNLAASSNDARNLLLQPAPGGDYEITTRVEFAPTQNTQQADLLVYQNDDNYLTLSRLYDNALGGNAVQFVHETGGTATAVDLNTDLTIIYLRIVKVGTTYTGYYSPDGIGWTQVGQFTGVSLAAPQVGLSAWNGGSATEIPADFDWFCLNTSAGIHGQVTKNRTPAAGTDLDLSFWNGTAWSTQATTTTGADGHYCFTGVSSLGAGQIYNVEYSNPADDPADLWNWFANKITAYTAGGAAPGGDFDVADIALTSPSNGAIVTLPAQFCWTPRNVPSDNYVLVFYYANTGETATTNYLGNISCVNLTGLPPSWPSGATYMWWVRAYQGDDPDTTPYNYGDSYGDRLAQINFAASASGSEGESLHLVPNKK